MEIQDEEIKQEESPNNRRQFSALDVLRTIARFLGEDSDGDEYILATRLSGSFTIENVQRLKDQRLLGHIDRLLGVAPSASADAIVLGWTSFLEKVSWRPKCQTYLPVEREGG